MARCFCNSPQELSGVPIVRIWLDDQRGVKSRLSEKTLVLTKKRRLQTLAARCRVSPVPIFFYLRQ